MNQFIGTWKLKSWIAEKDGNINYPYGKNPSGYISYLSDHLMTVVIMRDVADIPDIFESFNPLEATNEESIIAFNSYLSYWGSYEIDTKSCVITHTLEGCWYPKWIGTKQTRHFKFQYDLLSLSAELNGSLHTLVWQK